MKAQTFWQRLVRAVRGYYFVLGSMLVAVLVLAAVLGPEVAPHNPFLVKPIQWIDGELFKAPFSPSDLYPLGTDDLGRDQLSLLLYGARTTLVMAFFATVLRLLLGLVLGTIAGWWPGSLFDRAVTALTEFLAAIPGLILAMLVIFAVGIRRGQIAFIVGISLVGCGEVAQIVRGHVLSIRNELYILAARSVGLSSAGILSRHVLPNLLATFLALAALEMGGVLLLLGELGFVHVFIGGGRVGVNEAAREMHHYFDVPDWGAMLGTSWRWFRSYPWFPLAPAAAFFVSILGFNLFGYGLQRFIERGRFHPSGWSVIRFLLVVTLVLVGARALLLSTGVEAQFAEMARRFDPNRAWEDVAHLAQTGGQERTSGPGMPFWSAAYIAAQFEEAGLSPTTPGGSYLHAYTAFRGRVTAEPVLEVLDPMGKTQLRLTDGISFDPWQAFYGEGCREAELLVGANVSSRMADRPVLLALDPEENLRATWAGALSYEGVIRVVPDDELARRDQAPTFDTTTYLDTDRLPDFPNFLIGESAAQQVLALAGMDLDELQDRKEAGEEIVLNAGLRVRLTYGLVYQALPATNVVGYIAGLDLERRGERVLVLAPYGGDCTGADENASGIAVMLEMARLLQELEFVPKRTIAFAAFDKGGGMEFVGDPVMPTTRSEIWTTVILYGLGSGDARLARLESGSGLSRAFDQSARRIGVDTEELNSWRFFFETNASRLRWGDPSVHDSYQALAVTRPGDGVSGTPADTLDHVDIQQLAEAGTTLTHYVMMVSSR